MSSARRLLGICGVVAIGCTVPDLLENRACPCLEGWFCVDDICIRDAPDASVDAGTDVGQDASLVAMTCWLEPSGCDWDDSTSFELVEAEGVLNDIIGINFMFSPDACSILYARDGDLYFARRPGPDEPFRAETAFEVNTASSEDRATISPDGLELLFTRQVGATTDVFRSRRASAAAAWPDGTPATDINAAGLNTFDIGLEPGGLRFYFARPVALGMEKDIQVAVRSSLDATFGPAASVPVVSHPDLSESEPSVSANSRLMTFATVRGTEVERQLYYSIRADAEGEWSEPVHAPGAFLDAGDENEGPISPDGCEVLVHRDTTVRRLVHRPR